MKESKGIVGLVDAIDRIEEKSSSVDFSRRFDLIIRDGARFEAQWLGTIAEVVERSGAKLVGWAGNPHKLWIDLYYGAEGVDAAHDAEYTANYAANGRCVATLRGESDLN